MNPPNFKCILSQLGLDISNIQETTHFRNDLGLDSLGFIRLVMALNEAFQIQIQSKEMISDNFDTLGQLHRFIRTKTGIDFNPIA